jgi:outer membrane protein
MKKHLLSMTALALAAQFSSFSSHADFLSVSAGGGIWSQSSSGNFQKVDDPAEVNIKDDLQWSDETQSYLFVTLEHPVPILPNVRLMYTKLDQSGTNNNANFVFDGKPFSGQVSNDFSIKTVDLLAYYEVLDNVVSVDLGLNIRNLTGDYTISNGNTVKDSFNETVPMIYAMVGVAPLPDLQISGEINYLTFSGSTVSDMTAKVSYTTSVFVGFEAGYRRQTFEFDDVSSTDAKITFDGLFAGAYVKF